MNPQQPYNQQQNFGPYQQPGGPGTCPYPTGQPGMPQYGPGSPWQQQGSQGPQQGAMFQGPYPPGPGPQGPYQAGPGAMGPYPTGPPSQQPYPSGTGPQVSSPSVAPSQGPGSATAADIKNQKKWNREEFQWVHCSGDSRPPPDAVEGEGGVYVIRHEYKGDIVPGKWPIKLKKGYISSGGKEIELKDFEVLCIPNRNYQWLDAEKGNVPPGAVVGGRTSEGEPFYIARGRVNNEPCVGKVHPSHKCAYYPWGCKENKREKYSVLCFL